MNRDIKSTKMEIADIYCRDIQKNVERNLKEEKTILKEMEEIKFTLFQQYSHVERRWEA